MSSGRTHLAVPCCTRMSTNQSGLALLETTKSILQNDKFVLIIRHDL